MLRKVSPCLARKAASPDVVGLSVLGYVRDRKEFSVVVTLESLLGLSGTTSIKSFVPSKKLLPADNGGDCAEPPERVRLAATPEGGGGDIDRGLILFMTPCGGGGDFGRIGGKLLLAPPALPADATDVFLPAKSKGIAGRCGLDCRTTLSLRS
jgi:hypothetical protein